jgi:hypothetical protein
MPTNQPDSRGQAPLTAKEIAEIIKELLINRRRCGRCYRELAEKKG